MQKQQYTIVWDPFIRLFHWSLVVAFVLAYVTEDDLMTLHTWAGYSVLGLVTTRVLWGLIGSRHARFSDFIYSPATTLQFLKDTLRQKGKRYLGHNPAGGAMVIMLLLSLLVTSLTGVVLYGAEEGGGPLAGWAGQFGHDWAEAFEEVHEFFANFTVLLVFLHVAGVLIESFIHRENLVSSMFNGKKVLRHDDPVQKGN
jgi:cytochrome b